MQGLRSCLSSPSVPERVERDGTHSIATLVPTRRYRARNFEPGEQYGGVTVLKVLNPEARRNDRRYWVRYDCCERAGELDHAQLRQRGIRHASTCADCWKRKKIDARLPAEVVELRRRALELAMSRPWRVAS